MKIDEIRALAQIMKENGLTSLKIDDKDTVIELKRDSGVKALDVSSASLNVTVPQTAIPQDIVSDDENIFTVTAPMVGMFYASPGPKERPYVAIGEKVKAGATLCIIEAMKLMNEIASDIDGTVEEICVVNEQIVEFGQPLFRIRRDA